jgi:anhydro-N-acetylmuramic acid kinase
MNVIGLMSGTSADGIDSALVAFEGERFKLTAFQMIPYPPKLRKRVLAASSPRESRLEEVVRLNFFPRGCLPLKPTAFRATPWRP